jgi:hypothetical protein
LWADGIRKEWFNVESDKGVEPQLKIIEDQQGEEYQFGTPNKFYFNLVRISIETKFIKQKIEKLGI